MEVNYQVIVDIFASMLALSFPIFLILEIGMRFVNIFLDFVSGKKRVNL